MLVGKLVTPVCCCVVSTEVGSNSQRMFQTRVVVAKADTNIKTSSNQLAMHAGWTALKGAIVVSRGYF